MTVSLKQLTKRPPVGLKLLHTVTSQTGSQFLDSPPYLKLIKAIQYTQHRTKRHRLREVLSSGPFVSRQSYHLTNSAVEPIPIDVSFDTPISVNGWCASQYSTLRMTIHKYQLYTSPQKMFLNVGRDRPAASATNTLLCLDVSHWLRRVFRYQPIRFHSEWSTNGREAYRDLYQRDILDEEFRIVRIHKVMWFPTCHYLQTYAHTILSVSVGG